MRDALVRRQGSGPIPIVSMATVPPAPARFQPESEPRVRRATDPAAATSVRRLPGQPPARRWPLAAFAAALLLAGSGVVVALREMNGGGTQLPGAISTATATEISMPAVFVDPTATPTIEEVKASATELEATPTEPPPPTETPPPDDDDDDGSSPAPTVAFNEPFLVTAIPPAWQQGQSVSFGRDDFVEGGAYRRDDGVLYDRPAAHLYAKNTDYPETDVEFNIAGGPPVSHIGLIITGMDDELPAAVPVRITLNDTVVWEGESPFGNETWTAVGWEIGALDWLKPGRNRLTIEVLTAEGEFGLPPWILLTQAAVYWD
jgi:hypothetical protein